MIERTAYMMWLENYGKTTGKMYFPTKAERISKIKNQQKSD
tara:strand:+ start:4476 stop:4598 length:123 start_codon:yes stop_codon:yes gene_type:complete